MYFKYKNKIGFLRLMFPDYFEIAFHSDYRRLGRPREGKPLPRPTPTRGAVFSLSKVHPPHFDCSVRILLHHNK
jgi:hypothetical protein